MKKRKTQKKSKKKTAKKKTAGKPKRISTLKTKATRIKKKPAKKIKTAKTKKLNLPATKKTKAQKKLVPNKLAESADLKTLNFLEKTWPNDLSADIKNAFEKLRSSLKGIAYEESNVVVSEDTAGEEMFVTTARLAPALPPEQTGVTHFNPLDTIRRILMAQDLLFLSRQITYHVSANSDLSKIWGDQDRINQSFSRLIEHLVRRANRSSRINISIENFSLRNGPGIKISFESTDHLLKDLDSQSFLDSLLHGKADESSGISLHDCRQIVLHQRGQMWADLPKPHTPIYHVVLPATEEAARQPYTEQQTFKYDISITNYANVRKRFGIKKSASLVTQIEHYIRELVRYPIDMVMAIGDKGMITTIYETQKGSAHSVASRISQRLGKEEFRIGRKTVELMFKYQLSQLNPGNAEDDSSDFGRNN